MKIELLRKLDEHGEAGEVIDVSESVATQLIEDGLAIPDPGLRKPVAAPEPVKKPVAKATTADHRTEYTGPQKK